LFKSLEVSRESLDLLGYYYLTFYILLHIDNKEESEENYRSESEELKTQPWKLFLFKVLQLPFAELVGVAIMINFWVI